MVAEVDAGSTLPRGKQNVLGSPQRHGLQPVRLAHLRHTVRPRRKAAKTVCAAQVRGAGMLTRVQRAVPIHVKVDEPAGEPLVL